MRLESSGVRLTDSLKRFDIVYMDQRNEGKFIFGVVVDHSPIFPQQQKLGMENVVGIAV